MANDNRKISIVDICGACKWFSERGGYLRGNIEEVDGDVSIVLDIIAEALGLSGQGLDLSKLNEKLKLADVIISTKKLNPQGDAWQDTAWDAYCDYVVAIGERPFYD